MKNKMFSGVLGPRRRRGGLAILLLAVSGALPAPVSQARESAPTRGRLAGMLTEAEVIFQGVVRDVRYAMSDPVDGIPSLPHTFVTFSVERVFKGRIEGGSFTLRLLGGLLDDDRYMEASDIPWFDLDERMIVLARGNGRLDNPIVGETNGLMRVIGGRVYSYGGRPVGPSGDLRLLHGSRESLDEVDLRHIAGTGRTIRVRRSSDDDEAGGDMVDLVEPGRARPADRPAVAAAPASGFAQWLAAAVARLHDPQELADMPEAIDASPDDPFVGPDLRSGTARGVRQAGDPGRR